MGAAMDANIDNEKDQQQAQAEQEQQRAAADALVRRVKLMVVFEREEEFSLQTRN